MNIQVLPAPENGGIRRRAADFVGRYVWPRSATRPRLSQWFLLHPLVFAAWFHGRRLVWRLRGYEPHQLQLDGFVGQKALPYNLSNQWIINRARTERLMTIVTAIPGFDAHRAKILVVGPRNEAEILLLRAHGFRGSNIEAIDLFTYCPTIKLMDMHELKHPDNTFDAVYSSFVITYSDQIPTAIAETVRVAKDQAMVIFGFQHLAPRAVNKLGVNRLQGGTKELLGLFGAHVGSVYWTGDVDQPDGSRVCTVIFQLKKS